MFKTIMILLSLTLVLSPPLLGQISIPTNNFMPSLGSVIQTHTDPSIDAAHFNSLSAGSGGSMFWDFSARTYDPEIVSLIVDPASAPSIGSFPDANLVMLSTEGLDSIWAMFNSISTSFTNLGLIGHVAGEDYPVIYGDVAPDWVFPLNYNNQWTSHRNWTINSPSGYTITFDTTFHTVDAWGSAKYLSNTFPCLRVTSVQRVTINTYDDQDNLLGSFVQDITTVTFVASGFDFLLSAAKFTAFTIDSYSSTASDDLLGIVTDVNRADNTTLPDDFNISQNYPNPFNPSTEISLSVPTRSHVKLTVYDILGREVSVIVDRVLAAGSYTAEWDGRNQFGEAVASGVYFYRLTSDQFSTTRKMVLLK